MSERFELTAADRHSALWLRLKKHFEDRIAAHRAENDGDKDAVLTANIRGRIAVYKALADLDREDFAAQ